MMQILLHRIDLFYLNAKAGKHEAAYASLRLVEKYAAQLELKVWRYASRLIMESL